MVLRQAASQNWNTGLSGAERGRVSVRATEDTCESCRCPMSKARRLVRSPSPNLSPGALGGLVAGKDELELRRRSGRLSNRAFRTDPDPDTDTDTDTDPLGPESGAEDSERALPFELGAETASKSPHTLCISAAEIRQEAARHERLVLSGGTSHKYDSTRSDRMEDGLLAVRCRRCRRGEALVAWAAWCASDIVSQSLYNAAVPASASERAEWKLLRAEALDWHDRMEADAEPSTAGPANEVRLDRRGSDADTRPVLLGDTDPCAEKKDSDDCWDRWRRWRLLWGVHPAPALPLGVAALPPADSRASASARACDLLCC